MQVYWASIFILPKRVIKEVNNVLRKYFWSGADLQSTGAKIAWDDICIPKDEGGLGSKEVGVWNRAVVAKHIWFLIAGGEGSMWCQWVNSYLLRGRSFWDVKVPENSSRIWRKILGLRDSLLSLHCQQDG